MCTNSSAIALKHIVRFFENFDFEGENFQKEKTIVEKFGNFEEFSIFSNSEIVVL